MTNKIKILSASILLFSIQSYSAVPDTCADDYKVFNNTTQIQTGTIGTNTCFLSIDPFNNDNLIFRSYLLSSDSTIMIFNSYGDGPTSTTTGARVLMFFPRTQSLGYSVDVNNLNVVMSGITFTMDIPTTKFQKIDGVEFQEADTISPKNNGGLTIVSSQKLYLDSGFKMGSDPRADQTRTAIFHDAYQMTCEVANTELFNYKADSQNPVFNFASDSDLSAYLKLRCPNLKIDFAIH